MSGATSKLEKVEERKFCTKVQKLFDCDVIKQSTAGPFGRSSYPDRLVIMHAGITLWFEFKRVGGKVTPKQARCHKRLRALGQKVYVVYKADEAIWICYQEVVQAGVLAKALSEAGNKIRFVTPSGRVFSGSWIRKNLNKLVHLQDFEGEKLSGRDVRPSDEAHRTRNVATRNKQVERSKLQVQYGARTTKRRSALRKGRHTANELRRYSMASTAEKISSGATKEKLARHVSRRRVKQVA